MIDVSYFLGRLYSELLWFSSWVKVHVDSSAFTGILPQIAGGFLVFLTGVTMHFAKKSCIASILQCRVSGRPCCDFGDGFGFFILLKWHLFHLLIKIFHVSHVYTKSCTMISGMLSLLMQAKV